jgi:hypothetical protein
VRAWVHGIRHTKNPALLLLALFSLLAYLGWRRCRYFGTTAPLLTMLLITGLSLVVFPDLFAGPFAFRALPFAFVFMGGIFADLLESRWRKHALWLVTGLLAVYAVSSVMAVAHVGGSVLY